MYTSTVFFAKRPHGVQQRLHGITLQEWLARGPMPLARYMSLCLTHPEHGYYVARDPLGREGDFITAPEVSQMFGELLGLWAASVWKAMGAPDTVRLIELGPGRGTLMMDALRAIRIVPPFHAACHVHMVEINAALRPCKAQAECDFRLGGTDWVSLPMQDVSGNGEYVLRSLGDVDAAMAGHLR